MLQRWHLASLFIAMILLASVLAACGEGGNEPTGTIPGYTYTSLGLSLTLFPIPTPERFPFAITTRPDCTLWFEEGGASSLGRITPSGAITETIPIDGRGALTMGPDGTLW